MMKMIIDTKYIRSRKCYKSLAFPQQLPSLSVCPGLAAAGFQLSASPSLLVCAVFDPLSLYALFFFLLPECGQRFSIFFCISFKISFLFSNCCKHLSILSVIVICSEQRIFTEAQAHGVNLTRSFLLEKHLSF